MDVRAIRHTESRRHIVRSVPDRLDSGYGVDGARGATRNGARRREGKAATEGERTEHHAPKPRLKPSAMKREREGPEDGEAREQGPGGGPPLGGDQQSEEPSACDPCEHSVGSARPMPPRRGRLLHGKQASDPGGRRRRRGSRRNASRGRRRRGRPRRRRAGPARRVRVAEVEFAPTRRRWPQQQSP